MNRWLLLLLLSVTALALVAVPVWLIQPFSPQTPRGLEVGYALRRWAPVLTVVACAVGLALAAWLWRDSRRWWRRALVVVVLAPVFASAWFARQNHFEWMFNALPKAEYVGIAEARAFLVDAEVVMGIDVNGSKLAYPVRQLAYHHIVNEVVGGTPLVVTY